MFSIGTYLFSVLNTLALGTEKYNYFQIDLKRNSTIYVLPHKIVSYWKAKNVCNIVLKLPEFRTIYFAICDITIIVQ